MKKAFKLLFIFAIFSFINVKAVTVREVTAPDGIHDELKMGEKVIGITKFSTNTVITAVRAAKAGANDAIFKLKNNLELTDAGIYVYYGPAGWYEIKETGEVSSVSNNTVGNLDFYYVNNIEKQISTTYNGSIEVSSLPNGVNFNNNIITAPATLTNFSFNTSDGGTIMVNSSATNNDGLNVSDVEYSIKYYDTLGNQIGEPVYFAYNENTISPNNPTQGFDIFAGWVIKNTSTYYTFGEPLTGNLELQTVFVPATSINVDLNYQESVDYSIAGVTAGDTFNNSIAIVKAQLVEPVREGYHFVKWCLDTDCAEEFDLNNTLIVNNMTIYAKWILKENTPTITLAQNGGKPIIQYSDDTFSYAIDINFDDYCEDLICSINGFKLYKKDDLGTIILGQNRYSLVNTYTNSTAIISLGVNESAEFVATVYKTYEEINYESDISNTITINTDDRPTTPVLSTQSNITLVENELKYVFEIDDYEDIDGFELLKQDEQGLITINHSNYTLIDSSSNTIDVLMPEATTNNFIARSYKLYGSNKLFSNYSNIYSLTSKNIYEVTLVYDNGTANEVFKVIEGSNFDSPINPTKTNYFFKEWRLENEPTAFDFDTILTSDITLNAIYRNTTSVTLNNNGGINGNNSTIMTYNSNTNNIDILPTKEGNVFDGYYSALEGGTKYIDSNGDNAINWNIEAETYTLYAHWIPISYTISYHSDGDGIMSDTICYYGQACTLTNPTFTKENYEPIGYADTEGGEVVYTSTYTGIVPNTNGQTYDLYTVWRGVTMPYTVEFYFEDFEGNFIIDNEKTLNVNSIDSTKRYGTTSSYSESFDGFTFDNENINNTNSLQIGTTNVYKLYYKRNSYTLTFKDGDNTISSQSIKYNATITYPDNLEKTDYVFAGWDNSIIAMPNNDVTINARWLQTTKVVSITRNITNDASLANDTLTYDPLTGIATEVIEDVVNYSETAQLKYNITEPTGAIKWNSTNNLETALEISTNPVLLIVDTYSNSIKNTGLVGMKYYYFWNAENELISIQSINVNLIDYIDYSVTFVYDNLMPDVVIKKLPNQTVSKPNDPQKYLMYFDNWYLLNDQVLSETPYDFTTPITSNIKLKAVYNEKATITLDNNGGVGGLTGVRVAYNTDFDTLETLPTREGYFFLGYFDDSKQFPEKYINANGTSAKKYTETTNITLTAHWNIIYYNLKYNANIDAETNEVYSTFCNSLENCTVTTFKYYTNDYSFMGWATTPDGEIEYNGGENFVLTQYPTTQNSDINLYAIWATANKPSSITRVTTSPIYENEVFTYNPETGILTESITGPIDYSTKNDWSILFSIGIPNGATKYNMIYSSFDRMVDYASLVNSSKIEIPIEGIQFYETTYSSATKQINPKYKIFVFFNDEDEVIDIQKYKTVFIAYPGDYTKTFNLNYPNSTPIVIKRLTDQSFDLPSPSRDGYTFDGWYITSENPTDGDSYANNTTSEVFYAKWTEIPKLTLNGYGALCVDNNGQCTTDNDGIVYQKDDHNKEIQGENSIQIPISENAISTASITDFSKRYEEREGYLFLGWYELIGQLGDCEGKADGEYGEVGNKYYCRNFDKYSYTAIDFSNLTLTGEFKTVRALFEEYEYSISYNANGGEGSLTYDKGYYWTSIRLKNPENNITKEGYTFIGWGKNYDATTPQYGFDELHQMPEVNKLTDQNGATVTLYAIWQESVRTINLQGYGFECADTSFDGICDTDSNGIIYNYSGDQIIETDNNINVNIVDNQINTSNITDFTIRFQTKTGYNFIGWYEVLDQLQTCNNVDDGLYGVGENSYICYQNDKLAVTPLDLNNLVISEGTNNIRAVFEEKSYTLNVYDYNNNYTTYTVRYFGQTLIPKPQAREGLEFKGLDYSSQPQNGVLFQTSETNTAIYGSQIQDQDNDGIINLYDVWVDDIKVVMLYIEGFNEGMYDVPNGELLNTDNINGYNEMINRQGFNFSGWYTILENLYSGCSNGGEFLPFGQYGEEANTYYCNGNGDKIEPFDITTQTINSNIQLYGWFLELNYTVSFNTNGSITANPQNQIISSQGSINLPTEITPVENATFVGWSTQQNNCDGNNDEICITYVPEEEFKLYGYNLNSDILLYALWDYNTISVNYYKVNSVEELDRTLISTESLEIDNPDGYTFKNSIDLNQDFINYLNTNNLELIGWSYEPIYDPSNIDSEIIDLGTVIEKEILQDGSYYADYIDIYPVLIYKNLVVTYSNTSKYDITGTIEGTANNTTATYNGELTFPTNIVTPNEGYVWLGWEVTDEFGNNWYNPKNIVGGININTSIDGFDYKAIYNPGVSNNIVTIKPKIVANWYTDLATNPEVNSIHITTASELQNLLAAMDDINLLEKDITVYLDNQLTIQEDLTIGPRVTFIVSDELSLDIEKVLIVNGTLEINKKVVQGITRGLDIEDNTGSIIIPYGGKVIVDEELLIGNNNNATIILNDICDNAENCNNTSLTLDISLSGITYSLNGIATINKPNLGILIDAYLILNGDEFEVREGSTLNIDITTVIDGSLYGTGTIDLKDGINVYLGDYNGTRPNGYIDLDDEGYGLTISSDDFERIILPEVDITYSANAQDVTNMPLNASVDFDTDYTVSNTIPVRSGYIFMGWSSNNSFVDTYPGEIITRLTNDQTLYAIWLDEEDAVTIYYHNNGIECNNMPNNVTVSRGTGMNTAMINPSKSGYDFMGWSTTSNGEVEYGNNADLGGVMEDIHLYAIWREIN